MCVRENPNGSDSFILTQFKLKSSFFAPEHEHEELINNAFLFKRLLVTLHRLQSNMTKFTNRNILKLILPMQLCTRTERAVRRIIVFFRLQNKIRIELQTE